LRIKTLSSIPSGEILKPELFQGKYRKLRCGDWASYYREITGRLGFGKWIPNYVLGIAIKINPLPLRERVG
jgi:hypothetical protein